VGEEPSHTTGEKAWSSKIIQYCLEHPSNKANGQLHANQSFEQSKQMASIEYLLPCVVALLNERISKLE
jgi:hypothetical protein